jgi:hypothetical protein
MMGIGKNVNDDGCRGVCKILGLMLVVVGAATLSFMSGCDIGIHDYKPEQFDLEGLLMSLGGLLSPFALLCVKIDPKQPATVTAAESGTSDIFFLFDTVFERLDVDNGDSINSVELEEFVELSTEEKAKIFGDDSPNEIKKEDFRACMKNEPLLYRKIVEAVLKGGAEPSSTPRNSQTTPESAALPTPTPRPTGILDLLSKTSETEPRAPAASQVKPESQTSSPLNFPKENADFLSGCCSVCHRLKQFCKCEQRRRLASPIRRLADEINRA